MQAVILAGGKGTRLAERLNGRPKPLVEVGGVPLLQRQMEFLRTQGVDEFILLVNHASDQIEAFLAENHNFDCSVAIIDDGEPRGSAGAVLAALGRLNERFIVVYGDTLFNIDLEKMLSAHTRSGAQATLFLHPNDHPHDSDLVETDEQDRISAFHPYPHPPDVPLANQVNAALYVMQRSALAPWTERAGVIDFGKDLFPWMLESGAFLQGYRSFEYIKDLGTPKRLDRVERHLCEGVVARANLSAKQACVFIDRDGTLNVERGYVRAPEHLELINGAADAVRRLNDLEYRVAVVTNQPIIARGEVTLDGLRLIHAKLESDLGVSGAFVDRIYFCPHHPDKGFAGERADLKIACNCRKPMTGLLERGAADLNADRRTSWMIGDRTADVMAAERFGVRSILVSTGDGGRDGECLVTPDFEARDVSTAVEFIADVHPRLTKCAEPIVADIGAGDLVLIGGLARSGKSTLSSVIAHELRGRGLTVVKVSLDRWIRSQTERGAGLEGRFDLEGAGRFLAPWLAGGALDGSAPFYDRYARRRFEAVSRLHLPGDGVLILDGVPALVGAFPTSRPVHRIFVETSEASRAERMAEDLRARGAVGAAAAVTIYQDRARDESPQVLRSAVTAEYRVTLDDLMVSSR